MLNRDEVTVISPENDAESRTIIEICRRLRVDVRVSPQPWAAAKFRIAECGLRILGSAGAGWKPAILNAGKDAGAPRASSGAPPSR
ncbi:MAG TPA: hypothetical protein VLR94_02725, partial [Acidobacteriota bacterium]|nr:hypothetical protein [Acidobacteriota bacterium]